MYIYVCMYVYMYVYMYIYMYIYIYKYILENMEEWGGRRRSALGAGGPHRRTYIYIYIPLSPFMHADVCVHVSKPVDVSRSLSKSALKSVEIYICLYISVSKSVERAAFCIRKPLLFKGLPSASSEAPSRKQALSVGLAMTTTPCPSCSREWPSDRFTWAIPGVFHSDKHILGSKCVTFCAQRCQRPLYWPPIFDLGLYDLGLYTPRS